MADSPPSLVIDAMTHQLDGLAEPSAIRISVGLLKGFLGSGKTTLLNHLVGQPAPVDASVITDEFGETALDPMRVAQSTGNLVMETSGSCMCCSIRGDRVETLCDITWRCSRNGQRGFRRKLIETTGLTDSAPTTRTLMTRPQIAPKYRPDGIVATGEDRRSHRVFIGHTIGLGVVDKIIDALAAGVPAS